MKKTVIVVLASCLIFLSCTSVSRGPRNVNEISDISKIDTGQKITYDNTDSILTQYSMDFTVPNPLYGDNSSRISRFDPSHESTIHCRAILLDDFSTEADILVQCKADSLDEGECEEFRKNYIEKSFRDGMFRIRIEMESGFSEKSMEPEHWSLYLENSSGVMIEPFEIINSTIKTLADSVYSAYYQMHFPRDLMKSTITLYFKNRTFFGENLLGGENPFIVLVMSRKKKTVARVAWEVSERKKR